MVGVVEGKDYFTVTDELSKENAHFALSEALLVVIEQVQCSLIAYSSPVVCIHTIQTKTMKQLGVY